MERLHPDGSALPPWLPRRPNAGKPADDLALEAGGGDGVAEEGTACHHGLE